jgi:hypothetical protein
MDRWIQRATVVAMVAMALSLVGLGIAMYAPRAHAKTDTPVQLMEAAHTQKEAKP